MAGSAKITSLLFCNKKPLTAVCVPARHFSNRTSPRQSSYTPNHAASSGEFSLPEASLVSKPPPEMAKTPPLSILPLSSILRSLTITSISSSPFLFPIALRITAKLAHSTNPILNPDSNPLLRFALKHTFYKQFCAGENSREVKQTIEGLKDLGFAGVILGYAREVVMDESEVDKLKSCGEYEVEEACIRQEITPWAQGSLKTVKLTSPGDFVALKFTGAGKQALFDLKQQISPSPALGEAIDSICELAIAQGTRLTFDAEQQAIQAGINAWTLDYMRKYNGKTPGKAVVYGTYQAYLKATPSILASHLAIARKEGFTLGVKLVRGAYLGSDPRHLIYDTKAETDNAYNGIAAALASRAFNSTLKPTKGETKFPPVNVVLAGHNHTSVHKIQALRSAQAEEGEEQTDLVYAQLQGMADEISCELVQAGQVKGSEKKVDIPKVYKYLVWGTTGECVTYLLRRANENKEAAQRTREGRDAMAAELVRRVKKALGMRTTVFEAKV